MTLARFNPFQGLPNPREVWAWGMYDLANQSFTLLINTMFFGLYVQEVVAPDKKTGDRLWGTIGPVSLLIVVLIGPFLGAMADARGWKKRMLIGSGVLCVGFTCAFGFIEPGWMLLAALLYIPANIFYNIGENFLASFLPLVSTRKNIGRVSATGWAMGYIGALLLLLISGVLIAIFGWSDTAQYRPLFVIAGIWFAIVAIPTIMFLHEDRPERTARGAWNEGLHRMRQTIRDASKYAQLLRFLAVFFIYSMGTQVVIFFAGIITKDGFDFGTTKLVLFILQLTVTAGITSIVLARAQDAFGHLRTIRLFLIVWSVSTLGLAFLTIPADPPEWIFWVLSNGVGIGIGGIGTSSRAVVGAFTPAQKTGEFFGLWGLVYKLSGVVGPFAFGYVKAEFEITVGLFLIASFFVGGLLLLSFVDEKKGMAMVEDPADVPI